MWLWLMIAMSDLYEKNWTERRKIIMLLTFKTKYFLQSRWQCSTIIKGLNMILVFNSQGFLLIIFFVEKLRMQCIVRSFLVTSCDAGLWHGLLYCLTGTLVTRLDRLQNYTAWLVPDKRQHITSVFNSLQWFRIIYWSKYKILVCAYKIIDGTWFLEELTFTYQPTRHLQSEYESQITVPKMQGASDGNTFRKGCSSPVDKHSVNH